MKACLSSTEPLYFLIFQVPVHGSARPPPPPDKNLRGGGLRPHLSKKGVQKPVPVSRASESRASDR